MLDVGSTYPIVVGETPSTVLLVNDCVSVRPTMVLDGAVRARFPMHRMECPVQTGIPGVAGHVIPVGVFQVHDDTPPTGAEQVR